MYKKLIVGWILLAILAWAGPAGASGTVKRIGLTIFSALEVGQSARAVGMGSAFTPVGDDINAIWWNPAGLSNLDRVEVSFSHSQWFVNSTFNSGAIGIRKGIHAFGVSLLSFMPEEVEERTILQPGGTGRILSLGTTAIAGAYAIRFTDKLSFGVRIGWAREDLDLTNHTTFNVDFGTRFYTGFRSFRLSMSMRNFGKDTEVLRREFQQPLTFNIGGAAEVVGIKGDPFLRDSGLRVEFCDQLRRAPSLWRRSMAGEYAGSARWLYGQLRRHGFYRWCRAENSFWKAQYDGRFCLAAKQKRSEYTVALYHWV